MHDRGSMANLERALERTGHRVERHQAVVITHAHIDHCGQAPPIAERAGCEVWMHPAWTLHAHVRSRPHDRGRAAERRAGGAAAALGRAPPRRRAAARPGRCAPTATSSPASMIETDAGTVAGDRDARPRALARLPAPARAAAADLRRPPARPRLAVLRRRLHAGPGRRVPALARRRRRARRAARAGRPRAAVHRRPRPHRGQPRAGRASASTRSAPRSRAARAPPTRSRATIYGERFNEEMGSWLMALTRAWLVHLRGARRGRQRRRRSGRALGAAS